MLTIYGSMLCKDCRQCCQDLDKAGVCYTFLDFGQDLAHLKAFLKLREGNPLFDPARESGSIGIPCLLTPAGEVTLTWQQFL